ncbi:MAG: alanine/ornithine racemase family PLP-dependent enzyme [Thermoleophilia bacterium]
MSELIVRPDVVRQNTVAVSTLLGRHGLILVGVTKAVLGEPTIARAMLDGGAQALADTRDANLARLRKVFPETEIHRLHLPVPGRSFVPGSVNYVSSAAGLDALVDVFSLQAGERLPARVLLLVETGDGREGSPVDEVTALAEEVVSDPNLDFYGVGTNYACFTGPRHQLAESVNRLAGVVGSLERAGLRPERVSAGNSALLGLLADGASLPEPVTEIRCGEALLFGHDTLHYRLLPGAAGPACVVKAEVLERYTKASGTSAAPRAVLNIGSQDLGTFPVGFSASSGEEVVPVEVGRSSDYLVVEEVEGCGPLEPGRLVDVFPSYYALVAAWTSPFVEVRFE